MNLEEALKKYNLKEWDYVSLHNTCDMVFYGAYAKENLLKPYYDIEVLDFKKYDDNLYVIKINYRESLDLKSIKAKSKEPDDDDIEEAEINAEDLDEVKKKRRGRKKKVKGV